MTDIEKNTAIAQELGINGPWTERVTPCACHGNWALYNPSGVRLPDCCGSLDEMWEVEETLSRSERIYYDEELQIIAEREHRQPFTWHLKAKDKAEAFLRTKGLWKE